MRTPLEGDNADGWSVTDDFHIYDALEKAVAWFEKNFA